MTLQESHLTMADVRTFALEATRTTPFYAPGRTTAIRHKDGSYEAPWPGGNMVVAPSKLLKWKWAMKTPSNPTEAEAAVLAPSVAPDLEGLRRLSADGEQQREAFFAGTAVAPAPTTVSATWMGHASFLVSCPYGVNILTDPVWADRCSPVTFAGPKRFVAPPAAIAALPPIHIVTISHNHYDHLCHKTVLELERAWAPIFVVPLGVKARWFDELSEWGPEQKARVVELDWWHSATVHCGMGARSLRDSSDKCCPRASAVVRPAQAVAATGKVDVRITCVPAQHWSKRGPFDRNMELWGGFVVESLALAAPQIEQQPRTETQPVCRWIHSGDTGYSDVVFREIGAVWGGNFDLALLPIGAYEPRFVMQTQHVDPEEAVRIHLDLGAPTASLGMHWGTWILTDEPVDEPPRRLAAACKAQGVPDGVFRALRHGETHVVPLGRASSERL
jgi:N-acyl-phosphatidylethanolamine-hydrolysing phospholipase D